MALLSGGDERNAGTPRTVVARCSAARRCRRARGAAGGARMQQRDPHHRNPHLLREPRRVWRSDHPHGDRDPGQRDGDPERVGDLRGFGDQPWHRHPRSDRPGRASGFGARSRDAGDLGHVRGLDRVRILGVGGAGAAGDRPGLDDPVDAHRRPGALRAGPPLRGVGGPRGRDGGSHRRRHPDEWRLHRGDGDPVRWDGGGRGLLAWRGGSCAHRRLRRGRQLLGLGERCGHRDDRRRHHVQHADGLPHLGGHRSAGRPHRHGDLALGAAGRSGDLLGAPALARRASAAGRPRSPSASPTRVRRSSPPRTPAQRTSAPPPRPRSRSR